MDFFQRSGVNIANCVIVSGVTHTDKDNDIFAVLDQYGPYRKLMDTDDTSPYYKNLIVEYKSLSSMAQLKKNLPYTHVSESDPELRYYVTLPKDKSTKVKGTVTVEVETPPQMNYIDELKTLARRSGQKFEVVLQSVLSEINDHLDKEGLAPSNGQQKQLQGDIEIHTEDSAHSMPGQHGAAAGATAQPHLGSIPAVSFSEHQRPLSPPPRISLSHSDLNPPGIQRVVVEHVVRADELSTRSLPTYKLRPFSGRTPKPENEIDYDTWSAQIKLLLTDVNMPPIQITRQILESLRSPAAEVVKGLQLETPPTIYLQVLDSAYSTVQDGEELFAQFLNTLQDPGEKPSSYLHRLLTVLNTVVRRGGVAARDIDRHLLRQFCRGCWDNGIIAKLQLEQKRENPPSFAQLLLLLRTEEDRQLAKESLMKKHIGSSKQRAALHSQTCFSCGHTDNSASSIDELKDQVKKLQQQMSALLSRTTGTPAQTQKKNNKTLASQSPQNTRPRAGFCYKCGEDGHMVASCSQLANPALVQQKRTRLLERQAQWDVNKNKNSLN